VFLTMLPHHSGFHAHEDIARFPVEDHRGHAKGASSVCNQSASKPPKNSLNYPETIPAAPECVPHEYNPRLSSIVHGVLDCSRSFTSHTRGSPFCATTSFAQLGHHQSLEWVKLIIFTSHAIFSSIILLWMISICFVFHCEETRIESLQFNLS
jgi:hypothetical protein